MKEFEKATREIPDCAHKPPRSTVGQLGMIDFCKCGAQRYVLRYKGNDGSNRPGKRWDRW